MINVLATLAVLFFALVLTELLWHKGVLRGENSRKAMHIFGGVFAAFWPVYLSWGQVQLVAGIAVVFIILIRWLKLFRSVYEIKRRSWGDVIGPLTIALFTLIQPPTIIFTAVVLHIAIADGFAAILGVRYGKKTQYQVFGYIKSIVGTMAFFVISAIITISALMFSGVDLRIMWPVAIIVPMVTTFVENIGVYGLDNALIAITVATMFSLFQIA